MWCNSIILEAVRPAKRYIFTDMALEISRIAHQRAVDGAARDSIPHPVVSLLLLAGLSLYHEQHLFGASRAANPIPIPLLGRFLCSVMLRLAHAPLPAFASRCSRKDNALHDASRLISSRLWTFALAYHVTHVYLVDKLSASSKEERSSTSIAATAASATASSSSSTIALISEHCKRGTKIAAVHQELDAIMSGWLAYLVAQLQRFGSSGDIALSNDSALASAAAASSDATLVDESLLRAADVPPQERWKWWQRVQLALAPLPSATRIDHATRFLLKSTRRLDLPVELIGQLLGEDLCFAGQPLESAAPLYDALPLAYRLLRTHIERLCARDTKKAKQVKQAKRTRTQNAASERSTSYGTEAFVNATLHDVRRVLHQSLALLGMSHVLLDLAAEDEQLWRLPLESIERCLARAHGHDGEYIEFQSLVAGNEYFIALACMSHSDEPHMTELAARARKCTLRQTDRQQQWQQQQHWMTGLTRCVRLASVPLIDRRATTHI
mgnify:FL=1